jgi:prolipoprotein diacylglyceryltransferase
VPVPAGIDPSTVLTVHPTQLYETTLMLGAFFVLWAWRHRPKPIGWLFGAYLIFAGVERFLIEIVRAKDDRWVIPPFTLAQLTSVILVGIGVWILTRWKDDPNPDPGDYLRGGKDLMASKTSTPSEPVATNQVSGKK